MRFTALLASASLLSSVSAAYHRRQLPGFPNCADNCLNNPTNLGGCQLADETCLCKSLPFVQTTFACLLAACQGADQQSAIQGAENLCLTFVLRLLASLSKDSYGFQGVTLAAESSAIVAGLSTAGL
ncbi:hypothetical protein B0H17DRAFT_1068367 [Mycena rosella]|uniref:CFEM domain-containing protein n=1 Tax=Mycena rosella TaxID=1033263 RepID=A0AAD7GGV4_MYCRO|nr:hypothetical protein B0H17DRAFT_1068367 [Mycena rosella]